MALHYLEIVSDDADRLTELYQRVHGLSFGDPDPDLGQARIATRPDGSLVGIRQPLAARNSHRRLVFPVWGVTRSAGSSRIDFASPIQPEGTNVAVSSASSYTTSGNIAARPLATETGPSTRIGRFAIAAPPCPSFTHPVHRPNPPPHNPCPPATNSYSIP